MKRFACFIVVFLAFGTLRGYAEEVNEFTVAEVSPEMLQNFRKGQLEGILELERGDQLPFLVSVAGDIVSLSEETSPLFNFQVGKKMYIKCHEGKFLFSEDKTTWGPFDEQFKGMLDVEYGEGNVGPIKISMKNLKKGKFDGVLQIDEGATIPLLLSFKGDVLSFKDTSPLIHVEANRKFYVKMKKGDVLFSLDKEQWVTAADQFKGALNISFAQEESGPLGTVTIK